MSILLENDIWNEKEQIKKCLQDVKLCSVGQKKFSKQFSGLVNRLIEIECGQIRLMGK